MNFCKTPNSILEIFETELIGKSLYSINTNFNTLKNQTCFNQIKINTLEEFKNLLNTQTSSLSSFVNRTPKKFVSFDSLGNIVKNFGINDVIKNSIGNYTILFQTPFTNTNYLSIGNITSDIPGIVNIVQETPNQLLINIRGLNGTLFDPVQTHLLFFANFS
jgi:hypothetical protein